MPAALTADSTPCAIRYAKEFLRSGDGVRLCLHAWQPERPEAILFFIHGIQSHAGWLFETGPILASAGMAVYALDRRGSGISEGPRGHLPSLEILFADYESAWTHVLASLPGLPATALGQSLGGGILAGLAARGGLISARNLVFCAPALGQMHARLNEPERARIGNLAAHETLARVPVDLADSDYTDIPRYLEFMAKDPFMARSITQGTRAAMLALEKGYLDLGPALGNRRTVFIRPALDRILDLDASYHALCGLSGRAVESIIFPTSCHYLEFSEFGDAYRELLAARILSREDVGQ